MSEKDSIKRPIMSGSQLLTVAVVASLGEEATCVCPACGGTVSHHCKRSGNMLVKCPMCSTPLLLRVTMASPRQEGDAPAVAALGEPLAVGDEKYVITQPAVMGRMTYIRCGRCGKLHGFTSKSPGKKAIRCVACRAEIGFEVSDGNLNDKAESARQQADEGKPTVALRESSPAQSMGAISFGGVMGLSRKAIRLRVGQNTIGRTDAEKPSSISFNDHFMSRRSVMIEVLPADDVQAGFHFRFRVLNAANPVYVNKQQYAVGDSVYLNYGDTIKLGRTTMRFVKAKH